MEDELYMHSFSVFSNNHSSFKAVKNGWSWPAFFFTYIWAFCMQLWVIGFIFFPIHFFRHILVNSLDYTFSSSLNDVEIVILIFSFGINFLFGFYGNRWKRSRLKKAGYTIFNTVNASSKNDAISRARG